MPKGFYQRPTLEERFSKYVNKKGPDECWEWAGYKDKDGYGQIWGGTKMIYAHRVALEIYLGRPITPGLNVLHSCDNPSCVNHNHLREGTQKENMMECVSKNRYTPHLHPKVLTWDDVDEIRSRVGQTGVSLSKEFGVSPQQISMIRNNKTWIVGSAS